jgi:peroxiredoxin
MAVDLKGRALPDYDMAATTGGTINLARLAGYSVFFVYPWTGRPGYENPQGWDYIAGAHGSTSQALEYNKLLSQFAELKTHIFGVSSLRPAWQREFASRNELRFPLLSDEQEVFSNALELNWFQAGARSFLQRRTLIARNGIIIMDRQAIPHPEDDAGQTLALLRVLIKK